ncbi:hypothetical protein ABI59_08365 [Acidobacteria bacterium Mor1]|nr:hypothetical protein ABI59_08365 [Acidobacteria bacterium Mor1]
MAGGKPKPRVSGLLPGGPAPARLAGPILLLLLLALCTPAALAQTSPGTEITNVASASFPPGPPGNQNAPIQIQSNMVRTVVAELGCVDTAPQLSVSPSGTVAPGDALTYRLRAVFAGTSSDNVTFTMPFDPGLEDPTSFTDGTATLEGGGTVPVTANWDPLGRVLTWSLTSVPASAVLILEVTAAVRGDLPADSSVTVGVQADADGCPAPVDGNQVTTAVVPPVLQVRKRVDRATAAPGDAVVYDVEITHLGTEPALTSLELRDILPVGTRYVPGTARLDGVPLADPQISSDAASIRFPLGAFAPGQVAVLRYAVIVSAGAERGEAINRAKAFALTAGGAAIESPVASAIFTVVPGPFRSEAYLMGRVFVDDDLDGLPDADEPGIPGVLVMMEDGRGAVTDITGRWHLAGVRPGMHVLRIDPSTLGPELLLKDAGFEWAGSRKTRFVQARASNLVLADFPLAPARLDRCRIGAGTAEIELPKPLLVRNDKLNAAAATHLEAAAAWLSARGGDADGNVRVECGDPASRFLPHRELQELLRTLLARHDSQGSWETAGLRPATGAASAAAPGGSSLDRALGGARGSTGVHTASNGSTGAGPAGGPKAGAAASPAGAKAGPASAPAKRESPFDHILRTAPKKTTILEPADGMRTARASVNVDVLYRLGTTPELRVNGNIIPNSQIGMTSSLPSRGLAAARYVGVKLRHGINDLEIRSTGLDERGEAQVILPGTTVGLRLSTPEQGWVADGVTPAELIIEAVDAAGVRSIERPVITLDIKGAGRPLSADLDPQTPGHQVRLSDGSALVRFAPPSVPGRVHITAEGVRSENEIFIDVRPATRSWMVFGLAEGRVTDGAGIEGDGGGPPALDDGISDDGGRVALFARGPIGERSRLTVSIDSERDPDDDRLFRGDLEPDLFFPVSGDDSRETDEAPTQSEVYARIDGPAGFAQYGDFATSLERTELARYDRRMTGASGRVQNGAFTMQAFAASSDQSAARDVFEPDGSSGPFLLSGSPIVANSETVLIEVRDRFRTDQVLTRYPKIRDVDYDLDPIAGTILFRSPVAPFDGELNPMRIVVLYEVRSAVDDKVTGGARFAFQAAENFEIGASSIYEERPGDDLELHAVDLTWRPNPGTMVRGEYAESEFDTDSDAVRLSAAGRSGLDFAWEVSYQDLPENFANPSLLGSPELGSKRAGAKVQWEPGDDWRVKGEAFTQEDQRVQVERDVLSVDAEKQFEKVAVLAGVRRVESDSVAQGSAESTMGRVGIRGYLTSRLTAEVTRDELLDGENAIGFPTRTAAGLSYEFFDGQRLFARQEIESGDGPERDRTVLGIESRLGNHTRALNQYSLEDSVDGYALRSTTGVETLLPVSSRSALRFSLARLDTVDGADLEDYTTVAGGYEYRAGSSLFSTRYELRHGTRDDRHLLTGAGAIRPGEAWTLFLRERVFLTDPEAGERAYRAEGLFGVAFRPEQDRFRCLMRLEHSTGSGSAAGSGGVSAGGAPSDPGGSAFDTPANGGVPGLGTDPGRGAGIVDRDSYTLSFAGGARLNNRQRMAVTLIGRQVEGDREIGLPSTWTHLLSLHHTAQLHDRWAAGWSLRRFTQEETDVVSHGAGLELSYLALRNLWITGGYNFAGLDDPDFPGLDQSREGAFLSIRLKFDEDSSLRDLRLDR